LKKILQVSTEKRKMLEQDCKWIQILRRKDEARGIHVLVSECGRIAT
jgi:hypothetical protein